MSLSPIAAEVVIGIGAGANLVHGYDPLSEIAGSAPDFDSTSAFKPDLLIVPTLRAEDVAFADALRSKGVDVLEFAPHDFDEAFGFCRLLGIRLGRVDEARNFVREHSRELALISRESMGQRRPRVAAIVELDPLTIAGGHSFATDLIEIAGAESVTHGLEEGRIVMTKEELTALAPELIILTTDREYPRSEQERIRTRMLSLGRVEFLVLDTETIWLRESVVTARKLRVLIREMSANDGERTAR